MDRKKVICDSKLKNMNDHQIKCYEMFDNALSGKEVLVHLDNFYEEIDEKEEVFNIYRYSVLTDEMLEYDRKSLEDKNTILKRQYRPYFMSFIVRKQKGDTVDKEEQEKVGKWFKANFFFCPKSENDEDLLEGTLEISASPIIYDDKYKLKIDDKELTKKEVAKINNNYLVPGSIDDNVAQKELCEKLKDVHLQTAHIHKVGNGNLINIIGEKKGNPFKVLFDIGYHSCAGRIQKRVQYNNSVMALKAMNPNIVFISHWDCDHYLALVYAKKCIFEVPWFVPEIDDKSGINERRLVSYVHILSNKKIYLMQKKNDDKPIASIDDKNKGYSFKLYRGNGKGDQNKKNSFGFVISIKNHDVTSVFQADVPFVALKNYAWNYSIVKKQYDYLIVPHHGAKENTNVFNNYSKNDCIAIISGDGSKIKKNITYKRELENIGYDLKCTEDAKTYIEIDLMKKSSVSIY